jgi:iron complex transport system permease protein
MRSHRHPALLQCTLALVTIVIAIASLPRAVSVKPGGSFSPAGASFSSTASPAVVWSVRLPRIVMALLAGGALGLCGATLQGVFQNPLVDPHIIGVTSGSAFGGTLAILLGLNAALMMASTFLFGLAALMLVYLIAALGARKHPGADPLRHYPQRLFCRPGSLMQYLADSEETLPNIVFWLLGSFATASWHKVLLMALPVACAAMVLFKLRWRINLLALEEKDARGLGVAVTGLRRGVLVCCAVLVAAQVAVSGSIAWVGLVIPHLARLLAGADHRRLLPPPSGSAAVL